MKIISWGIIFVVVIFSFSFVNRTILNNKMDIMQEEVRYNNAITEATMDATREISNQMNDEDTQVNESYQMVLTAVDKFFETFSLSTGYYGGNQKDSIMKMYVPAISVLTYDGFYISSLENINNKLEHTLKPEVGYTYMDGNNRYINFTMDNYIKTNTVVNVWDAQLGEYKNISEGYIVDLRHYYDIETRAGTMWNENGIEWHKSGKVCYYTKNVNGKTIKYEKSFYTMNHVRYLLEEWYQVTAGGENLIYKRMTRYTEDDYNFTFALKNKGYSTNIVNGNPENEGFTDPMTGEYEIGEFNKIRRQTITGRVTEKLQYYILLHNKFAKANGITYTFTLPEIKETDWENAIKDVSVFAFVQGISLLNQEYYNNYSFSGARIVDKEVYYGIPPKNPTTNGGKFTDATLPIYYSSRKISETNRYLLERNNARIFYSREDAADYGYYPNVNNDSAVVEEVIEEVLDIKIDKTYLGCLTRGGRVYIPIEISGSTVVSQLKWAADVSAKDRYYFNTQGDSITNYHYDPSTNKTYATLEITNFYNANSSIKFSIYVRDISGNSNVVTTDAIDILDNNFSFGETTPYTSYTNPNQIITMSGRTNNRTTSNLMRDNNGRTMVYYTSGHRNPTELNGYYSTLKLGNSVSGISFATMSGNRYSFSGIPGKYTIFGFDCTGTFKSIAIDSTGAFSFTYKESRLYNAAGAIVVGAGTVTRARVYIQSNRRPVDISIMKWVKGEYTLAQMRSMTGTNINSGTYNSTDSTFYFEVTENAKYTVYARDVNGQEQRFVVNMIGIGSDRIKITMTWTNGPDLDFHLKGKDAGNNDFHIWYSNKTHYYNGELIADLPNGDIRSNNGLEIINLYKPAGGIYTFYVTHYSGTNIGGTGAVLNIYRGESGSEQLIQTLNVPSGAYKHWKICTYDADTRELNIYSESSALTNTEP